MSTTLISHPDCLDHELPGHPERPERLQAILGHLKASGILDDLEIRPAEEATRDQIGRTHPKDFIDFIENQSPQSGESKIDLDTYMSSGSLRATRLAAGACAQAAELVASGERDKIFCAIRPPGHHTELRQAMGFCLFNNIAIAADAALLAPDIERVAILDFDVHHCNGTVDIFKERKEVLVCSSFQYPFYPNRYLDYSNGHIVTAPLEAGSGSNEFRMAVETIWLPAIEQHKPDMILVSAGFDGHTDDPLGELNLTDQDYLWVTRLIVDVADRFAKGRIVSTLEGGYDLGSLSRSVQIHLEGLME